MIGTGYQIEIQTYSKEFVECGSLFNSWASWHLNTELLPINPST